MQLDMEEGTITGGRNLNISFSSFLPSPPHFKPVYAHKKGRGEYSLF